MPDQHLTPNQILDEAHRYAKAVSGCTKVVVASMIHTKRDYWVYGANRTIPNLCKSDGCLRVTKYGTSSKEYRGPADCRAIHSEVDAICCAANRGVSLARSTIYITRYPCEACARAIVTAGIKRVYYGRQQEVSEETKEIFRSAGVRCVWVSDWTAEDVTT